MPTIFISNNVIFRLMSETSSESNKNFILALIYFLMYYLVSRFIKNIKADIS